MEFYARIPKNSIFFVSKSICNTQLFSAEFATEPKALSERSNGKACDGEAEVGYGVQRLPGVGGRLHEHAGMSDYNLHL